MILVDTSVLIDLFKDNRNLTVDNLREIINQQIPFGITSVIYREILQGAKNEKEYATLTTFRPNAFFTHRIQSTLTQP